MIYRSPFPDVELPDLPLTTYVLAGAGHGDKPALIDGVSGRVLTYADLASAIRSLAGGLVASGFAQGDVLALMAPNMPEYAVVFHAAAMAGGVVTTINPAYTEPEVRNQLKDCGARILVTVPPLTEMAARACTGTKVAEIYTIGEAEGAKPLSGLFGAPLAEHVPVAPDDVVALPYSSGTTGLCKGVMLTHRNLVVNTAQLLALLQLQPDDSLIAVLPFFHIYGMEVMMKGYLNNPQATAAMIEPDGWLHTGDLGHLDADGHLYVVDRLKELIKYKGFQVPPAELEAVLLRHRDVTDAAVVGLPDEEAGEIPFGYVTLRPGASASLEEIMQFAAAQVASYKQIRRLEVVETI
ncbi:MAG: AMP-binding protein, partial [Streptosporangiaceae bacterium]